MTFFQSFLNGYRSGEPHNFTTISPPGKFFVPDDKLDDLYKRFADM